MWTLEWFTPISKVWKPLRKHDTSWPLEEAVKELRREYEYWYQQVGWVSNANCEIRLRNRETNEIIPVDLVI